MLDSNDSSGVQKLQTGIDGLDLICNGGLPKGRVTLVSGTSGSAKTVLACQFLAAGVARFGEAGVFITFEEAVSDVRKNAAGFGWDIARWEEEGKWVFVDASPTPEEPGVTGGEYNQGALLARIEYAVRRVGATRVSVDSLGALFTQLQDETAIRSELGRIVAALKKMGVTGLITGERVEDYGPITRYGLEEFVADNVIVLRQVLEADKRRRTMEIIKFRGASHRNGEFPFAILPENGIVVTPVAPMELVEGSSDIRIPAGIAELDEMCAGGFFKDSVTLVAGAAGTGKTLMAAHFLTGGVDASERSLLFSFEESRVQLYRNAKGWGIDFEGLEKQGRLKILCEYPEIRPIEDHLARMVGVIKEFSPGRVAVDSLSALQRVSTLKGFREFVIGLASVMKHEATTGMFTVTTPTLSSDPSFIEAHISTIADCIIFLRHVEVLGEMRRGLNVLKMRGSMHDRDIREFTIDRAGMRVGEPLRNAGGIPPVPRG